MDFQKIMQQIQKMEIKFVWYLLSDTRKFKLGDTSSFAVLVVLDQTHASDRKATMVLTEAAISLGHDL